MAPAPRDRQLVVFENERLLGSAIQRVKGAAGRRIGKSQKTSEGRKYYDGIGLHADDEQDPREAPDDDPDNWGL